MPTVADTPATTTAARNARRAPDVSWALSSTMQELVRHAATHARLGGPTGIVGEAPYIPQAIERASRVVVIGKRATATHAA
jgi:hypothetical protein